MIKDKKTAFAIYVVLVVVFWNIAEKIWLTLKGGDVTAGIDIITPLVVGLVTGYLFFLARQVDINDELKEARKDPNAVIVDVRGADEYAEGHIPGAVSVPADDLGSISSIVTDKDTPIYTYCLRGSRSSRAAKDLRTMGYSRVINMGGINKYKGEQLG